MAARGLIAAVVVCVVAGAGLLALVADVPATQRSGAAPIVGVPPGYGPRQVAEVPNAAAIVRRLWVPGLAAGYDPQGLTVANDAVFVAAYRSRSLYTDRGPCRVFRLDPRSGAITGRLDVPPPCGHAGGMAAAAGILYVADTHTLFAAPLDRAFAPPPPNLRRLQLEPGLVGALAASAGAAIWLGTYSEKASGRLSRFDASLLASRPDGAMLNKASASALVAIPTYAQGAAIDRSGRLWIARSTMRWGELDLLGITDGSIMRRYQAPPGIEGIAFDAENRLWAVSEAGARHVYDNFFAPFVMPFYPLVVAIDPRLLR